MKMFILLLVTSLQVSAVALAQNISINVKNARLDDVLQDICLQTKLSYSINPADIPLAKPVTINLKNQPIDKILQNIFSAQTLTYTMQGRIVIVRRKEATLAMPTEAPKRADVTGRIIDETGQPLSGATVAVAGTQLGTVSGEDGRFTIPGAPENGTLLITMIGRESKEIAYRNGMAGNISLREVDQELKEIVVAYGKVKEKYITSNAFSISGEVISRQPVTNPLIALKGQIPGLFIRQTNGLNTGSLNITVQGNNSMINANTPFFVIDGVPFTPNSYAASGNAAGSITSGAGISNLNFINPNEIESITVLKDADATAIYGSRAANGAILITTKKGQAGQAKVNLSLQNGWGKTANQTKVLNTSDYIALRKEAIANGGGTPSATDLDVNGTWDGNRNINWQDELINETAQYQNAQISLSGGSDKTQYLVGAGFNRETPVFKGDFSNVKSSVNFNINHLSKNEKFRLFFSGSYLDGTNKLPTQDISSDARRLAPNFPNLYNADGTINWAATPDRPFQATYSQPAATLLSKYTAGTKNLISNATLSYEVVKGLTFKSTFGYNSLEMNERSFVPSTALAPEDRFYGVKPNATFSTKQNSAWIIEPQAAYNRAFSFGVIDALVGSTFQSNENSVLSLYGEEYNSDAQLGDINAAGKKSIAASIQSNYKYSAVFGRLNYRLKDRYIINLAGRRDGSSRFGSENQFHTFYSVGAAWLFTEEAWFTNVLPILNYGKLRSSYGTTGNDQIGDYAFYSLYNTLGLAVPYLGVSALVPDGHSNPYLQWEETRKLNFGVDLGFLNNRVILTGNFFRNRSSNQLLSQNLSIVTGFPILRRNFPATVQNTGWEFNLQYTPIKSNAFQWQGSFNITVPKNKLIRYDGLEESEDANNYVIGESINIQKRYAFQGVNPQTGLYEFRNAKGETTSVVNDPADRISIVTLDPKWYGGLHNSFSYKHFTLDFQFQFSSQLAPSFKFQDIPGISYNVNNLALVKDHWKKPGDQASLQMVTTDFGKIFGTYRSASDSDGAFRKATYARLNNAALSYNFNNDLLRQLKVSNARVYLQGQNLFTITDYDIADPEIQGLNNVGLLRMYTIGAQLTF